MWSHSRKHAVKKCTTLPILRENIIEMEQFKTQESYSKSGQNPSKHETALQYTNDWN